jgi:galactokinase/mevalonate kinase-like predicted kinase
MFLVDPVCRMQVINVLSECEGQVIRYNFTKNGDSAWRLSWKNWLQVGYRRRFK